MLWLIWALFLAHVVCFVATLPTLTDGERIGGAVFTVALLAVCLLASSF